MLSWDEYVKIFVALLVIIDPIGIVPMFLTLTSKRTPAERRRAARLSAMAMALVLMATVLVGDVVMRAFGTGIPAFQVGAGIILLLMAIPMLHAQLGATRQAPGEAEEAGTKEEVALVPLAIPLLAGPGAISMIVVYAHRGPVATHGAVLCGIILLLAVIVWAALRLATPISRLLGHTGINIANRLMGLILAAVAVGLIAEGLKGLFPALGKA